MAASLAGKLLVANPRLVDPNFDRSVLVLLAHGAEGALGVVLDRPGATPVAELLLAWSPSAAYPAVMFKGGPVGGDSVIALAEVPDAGVLLDAAGPGRWQPVLGPLGTLDLESDPDRVAGAVSALRLFVGYAGWGPGQLEGELAAGAWWVLDGGPGDVFTSRPGQLWHDVLRRQPPELALVAAYPPDPRVN